MGHTSIGRGRITEYRPILLQQFSFRTCTPVVVGSNPTVPHPGNSLIGRATEKIKVSSLDTHSKFILTRMDELCAAGSSPASPI